MISQRAAQKLGKAAVQVCEDCASDMGISPLDCMGKGCLVSFFRRFDDSHIAGFISGYFKHRERCIDTPCMTERNKEAEN